MKARLQAFVGRLQRTRPARVWSRYQGANGPLLAQGLSYQSVFAGFAALWVSFAALGLWIQADSPLQNAIIDTIDAAVPGLLDRGEGGAIALDQLLSAQILGWTGAIAAVGLIWRAIAWFGATRSAVRAMLGQLGMPANAVLLKLKDAGLALGFGVAVLVSAAISLLATSLLGVLLGWIGIDDATTAATVASRVVALLIALAFDTAMLWALYGTLAATRLPARAHLQGAVAGAVALGVLKALGGALLGGASSNPLLASFAVLVGLLIWLNLVCMVLLLGAAWVGEGMERRRDAGDPAGAVDAVSDEPRSAR